MIPAQKKRYYFHAGTVRIIQAAAARGQAFVEVSLDLNLSCPRFELQDNALVLDRTWQVALQQLEPIVSMPQKVFVLDREGLFPIEVRADGYYKLVPTDTAPTLEINGIKMHRSKEIDPFTDARMKTDLVVKSNDLVLDTCGGLGYSALFALKAGAQRVVSVEKSRPVIQIRCQNPWLPADDRIQLVQADVTQYIQGLDDHTFDAVIHDPPRFTSATGELYGKAFYEQLFRVMKPISRLFHYTGSPQKIKHPNRFIQNTIKRLEQAGFQQLVFKDQVQGIQGLKSPGKRQFPWVGLG